MASKEYSLGRLEKVELREVWGSEPADFTPWLAKDVSLQLLGEAIGGYLSPLRMTGILAMFLILSFAAARKSRTILCSPLIRRPSILKGKSHG